MPTRVVIEAVEPEVDCGRFPAKAVVGDRFEVEATAYCEGHEKVAAVLLHRREGAPEWSETPMEPLVDDRWRASFPVTDLGRWEYTVMAYADRFGTWREGLEKKAAAGVDVHVDLLIGAEMVEQAARRAPQGSPDARTLAATAATLHDEELDPAGRVGAALSDHLQTLMARHADREGAQHHERTPAVTVDPKRARFSTWYEMFPRSAAPAEEDRHGTFADVEARLDDVAAMGFDVLYLPPIHPIGHSFRKGRNNATSAQPDDVGSPWAIGSEDGGHTDVHTDLGTLDDFRRLVERARSRGIEVALDVAFQCSPDHPWVKEHPEWFRHRPDGTIQHAENPPKRYEDIYPLDFESPAWPELWRELKGVFDFWVGQGVRTFRVDNPHTKPFAFWEWCIGELKRDHPDLVLLSEAFTRPSVMYRLAKLGFTQSYTYFAWRHSAWELRRYLEELTSPPVRHFFRPNAWPNTPDILTEELQHGGRPAFVNRLVLAATLCASYGIYGPPYELMEARAREPGGEEYLDSEKYQLRRWDLDRPDSLRELIGRVNGIRRDNPALHEDRLTFHDVENERILAYSKASADGSNVVLVVSNVDPHWTQSGFVRLDLEALGLAGHDEPFQVHDVLGGGRYQWQGEWNYVELNPHVLPAHVFVVRRRARTERDFDYFV